jgi:hypothetical protein
VNAPNAPRAQTPATPKIAAPACAAWTFCVNSTLASSIS